MPTTDQLQSEINALTARLNSIDGQGLTDPSLAVLTVLTAKIAGLQTTIRQTSLALQTQIQGLQAQLTALQNTLNTHLGT